MQDTVRTSTCTDFLNEPIYSWRYLLLALRRNLGLTQAELAQKLNNTDKVISNWENNRCIPNDGNRKLLLSLTRGTNKNFRTLCEEGKKLVNSSKPYRLSDEERSQIIHGYTNGTSIRILSKKYRRSVGNIWRLLDSAGVMRALSTSVSLSWQKRRKTKPPSFPASDWARRSKGQLTKEDAVKLLAVLSLTDGGLYKIGNRWVLRLTNKAKIMHDIFSDLVYIACGKKLSVYFHRNFVSNLAGKRIEGLVTDLLGLSPTYSTGANSERGHPDLAFLLNSSQEVKIHAIRLEMSAEGSISVRSDKRGIFSPMLEFACAHLKLIYQWQRLFQCFGVDLKISKSNKTWSGYEGLRSNVYEHLLNFARIGFIDGVRIRNSPRVYFPNYNKNSVLFGVRDFIENIIKMGVKYTGWSREKFWKTVNSYVGKYEKEV